MLMSTESLGLSAMAEIPASSVCSLHVQDSGVLDAVSNGIASDIEQGCFRWRCSTGQTLFVVPLIRRCDDNLSTL